MFQLGDVRRAYPNHRGSYRVVRLILFNSQLQAYRIHCQLRRPVGLPLTVKRNGALALSEKSPSALVWSLQAIRRIRVRLFRLRLFPPKSESNRLTNFGDLHRFERAISDAVVAFTVDFLMEFDVLR